MYSLHTLYSLNFKKIPLHIYIVIKEKIVINLTYPMIPNYLTMLHITRGAVRKLINTL